MEKIVNSLLQKTTISLADYLEKVLPTLFKNWWEEAVLSVLTFPQQRRVQEQRINSLKSLDLAATLRVLDKNWFQMSAKINLPAGTLTLVKEMQGIRNRYAHIPGEGFTMQDVYRDLDTLHRFIEVIDADTHLIQEVNTARKTAILRLASEMAPKSPRVIDNQKSVHNPNTTRTPEMSNEEFTKIHRIERWAGRPHQINHKIIKAYLELEKKGTVYLDDLKSTCSNNDSNYYVGNFNEHYASMKTDAGNSHGKVFYNDNTGIVSIFPRVREEIRRQFEGNG